MDAISTLQHLLTLHELNIILTTVQLSRQLSLAARIDKSVTVLS